MHAMLSAKPLPRFFRAPFKEKYETCTNEFRSITYHPASVLVLVYNCAKSCVFNFTKRLIGTPNGMTHVEEKMASLLKQLQELSDPSPAEFHPDQEDWDLLTGARVSQSRTYDDEGVEKGSVSIRSSRVSKTRKRLAEFESDPRYAGKTVSRKELYGYENEGRFAVNLRFVPLNEVLNFLHM